MAQNVQRYLRLSVTQGSAGAFVEGSVATNIDPASGLALLINEIEVQFDSGTPIPIPAGAATTVWSVCRDTKLAVATYDDTECVYSDGIASQMTTSGAAVLPTVFRYKPAAGLLIVEPNSYFQLDCSYSSVALTAHVRMSYETVKLSEVEILRLLNNV